jgi:iron complex transport system ATP-binding protein
VLEVRGVWVKLGRRDLLCDIQLSLGPGELVVLVGPNGAGKTTLLKACLGLVEPSRGEILYAGRRLGELGARERARHLSWLPQQLPRAEPWPVEEVVAAARYRFSESRAYSLARARELLGHYHLGELGPRPVTELSGGERQRVALAVLLAQQTPLCLLDEPATHLDPAHQQGIYGELAELVRDGLGVLVVTHDVNLVVPPREPESVRILGLGRNRLIFDLTLGDPALSQALGDLFGVSFDSIEYGSRRLLVPRRGEHA